MQSRKRKIRNYKFTNSLFLNHNTTRLTQKVTRHYLQDCRRISNRQKRFDLYFIALYNFFF